jgi:hypothetical protein
MLTTIDERIAAIQAPPHSATSLSNHDNNQLGREGILCVSRGVFPLQKVGEKLL